MIGKIVELGYELYPLGLMMLWGMAVYYWVQTRRLRRRLEACQS